MRLSQLQSEFVNALRSECEFARVLGPRIEIYRNNYKAQLRAALLDTYKHLHLWLGHDEFGRAADIHIDRSPPHSWTLDHYGRDFPATLADLFPNDLEVVELAWLDLAMTEAFVAEDAEPLAIEALGTVDWDGARFRFVPSMHLSETATNAADIWEALESNVTPPAPRTLREQGGYVVWRPELAPRFRVVSSHGYRAIAALHLGMSFGDLCKIISAEVGEDEALVAAGQLLRSLFDDGLIAQVMG